MSRYSDAEFDEALDLVEEELDAGDPEQARQICEDLVRARPESADARFLLAESHRDLGDVEVAEREYRRAVGIDPHYSTAWGGLAGVLFDTLRFDEARSAVGRAIRENPENAQALYVRGLLRERRGDDAGARRDFWRANRFDPAGFPRPVPLDDATVSAVVEETIRELHPTIQEFLSNVALVLEELPDEALCREFDPPMPPSEILGWFGGPTTHELAGASSWGSLPPTIVFFRKNLERIASDRERMITELRITVFHEIGHFLGLDEEDLAERGLD
jgi:predicted Zn-dependent protease with MMP-like domain